MITIMSLGVYIYINQSAILPFVTLMKYRIGLLMLKISKHTIPISISSLYKLNNEVGFIYPNTSAPYSIVGITHASYNWEYIS